MNKVKKGWGYELIFANEQLYCGKILHFNAGEKTSMHFHSEKVETFYALSGEYNVVIINTNNASRTTTHFMPNDKMDIPRLCPHQIESIIEGDIVEVSTHDNEYDSYRIEEGSTQRSANVGYQHQQVTPDVEGDYEFREPSPDFPSLAENQCAEELATIEQEREYHLFEF